MGATVLVSNERDALAVEIVPCPRRRIDADHHAAVALQGDPETLDARGIIDSHSGSSAAIWNRRAGHDPRLAIGIPHDQAADTKRVGSLLPKDA